MNNIPVPAVDECEISFAVLKLNSHEQKVLLVVLALIFLGVAARIYRQAGAAPEARTAAQP